MQRITLENKFLKDRMHNMEKQQRPLQTMVNQIYRSPSPQFSVESKEQKIGSKYLKKGSQRSAYHK